MVNNEDLKELSKQHLKTAEALIKAQDWPGAAYMLGYVLEFLLKAATCKTLNLLVYPESHAVEKIHGFFRTHNFDQLLMVSGTSDLFDISRGEPEVQQHWSDFTSKYLGDWPGMRYNKDTRKQFTKITVNALYKNLVSDKKSIIKILDKEKRC